jgi:hypothetical protein
MHYVSGVNCGVNRESWMPASEKAENVEMAAAVAILSSVE